LPLLSSREFTELLLSAGRFSKKNSYGDGTTVTHSVLLG
jgi:hypothetical protein